jgi:muramidase (phage lysozyme)
MLRVANCESGFHPEVHNKTSTASGLFQFLDSTWKSQSAKYEVYTLKDDPYGQIEVATRMIADGGIGHWNASKSCWQ